MYTFEGAFYDKSTGLHPQMLQIMLNPNHNRPLIKKSVLYVRNYKTGRGLRDLTWSLLFTISLRNQHLALSILTEIVYSGAGCWKDPVSFAKFCNKYGQTGLHEALMQLYVKQLLTDLEIYDTLTPDDIPRLRLSLSAKYTPRERSWLHSYIMIVWNRLHPLCNRIINTQSYNTQSALNKCNMIYRQEVSKLNKALETTEIAMCAGLWETIKPSKIPLQTQLKYKHCLKTRTQSFSYDNFVKVMPLWLILKYAYETPDDAAYWQSIWKTRTKHIKSTQYVVPCLELRPDIFEHSNKQLLFKAFEKAIITAKQSLFGNFTMVFSQLPLMVDLTGLTIIEAIHNLENVIIHEINPCLICGTQVVLEALQSAGITSDEMQHINVKIITPFKEEGFVLTPELNIEFDYVC